jgi:hypothetical protein
MMISDSSIARHLDVLEALVRNAQERSLARSHSSIFRIEPVPDSDYALDSFQISAKRFGMPDHRNSDPAELQVILEYIGCFKSRS